MERAQDVVSAAVGVTLVILAAIILVAGVVNFVRGLGNLSLTLDATDLLDEVLLVLILVEIVHTVVLSLRAHALSAQPFIVVGLVAVIRKILFALGSQERISVSQLLLYILMAAVFVGSLVAVQLLDSRAQSSELVNPTSEPS
ncbi:MAG: phosphate-starvation-inducible PsiE family protein [Acidimicrobiales bacterium]